MRIWRGNAFQGSAYSPPWGCGYPGSRSVEPYIELTLTPDPGISFGLRFQREKRSPLWTLSRRSSPTKPKRFEVMAGGHLVCARGGNVSFAVPLGMAPDAQPGDSWIYTGQDG